MHPIPCKIRKIVRKSSCDFKENHFERKTISAVMFEKHLMNNISKARTIYVWGRKIDPGTYLGKLSFSVFSPEQSSVGQVLALLKHDYYREVFLQIKKDRLKYFSTYSHQNRILSFVF
jgi:hypothetical protein